MNKCIALTFFISSSFINSYGQSDTLNHLDSDGKKTGWWITYLDENLEVLKDSSGAKLCMYNYYLQNIYLYRFGEGYGSKKHPIIFPDNNTSKLGDYILLNGEYLTKYKNGNIRSVLSASEGFMSNFKQYYPTGELKFELIISNECGAPKQHCIKDYHKDGSLKHEGHTWLPKN